MQKLILESLLFLFFFSCSYSTVSRRDYPFSRVHIRVSYNGEYASVPSYFKPTLKEELKFRISNLDFVSTSPDLCIKIELLSIKLTPTSITYLDTHPVANNYLLSIKLRYSFKTYKNMINGSLERTRSFSAKLDLMRSNLASVSRDYSFRDTARSLAKDMSRELINRFLAQYNTQNVKEKESN